MRSNHPTLIDPTQIPSGTEVIVYYKSSKQNEANEWIPAKVQRASQHIVTCRKSGKGPPMNVAYEDLRLLPKGELT